MMDLQNKLANLRDFPFFDAEAGEELTSIGVRLGG
jgi:hypothetical protein